MERHAMHRIRPIALAALLIASSAGRPLAGSAPAPPPAAPLAPPAATPVTVERVRPEKEKLPSLEFLRANRDFIRARFDLLRERPATSRGEAAAIDPRYLAYERMLAEIHAARESVAVVDDDMARQQLFASVTELGRLENQLDQMDRLIGDQRLRLQTLQDDFTGRQRTALMVVVTGDPGDGVAEVDVTLEGGGRLTVSLFAAQRAALRQGGVVEVFHGFIEPRDQVVEVGLIGPTCPAGDRGFVSLSPVRDRLMFLRLDLAPVQPGQGAAAIHASTWLHEAKPHGIG
ncbi:MAG: hypothetical protein HYR74_02520 [Candidatus Eisenbacteria bacterium]|nr:hypothetical protein [Candidatus Eisenbacteria bacterium]